VKRETEHDRSKRMHQRVLFDDVAELYDATRAGYPSEVVDEVFRVAELGDGSRILEIGCGTGQLTVDLARRGVELTAIDIGASMVAATRKKVSATNVVVEQCAFEDLEARSGTFACVVSATAFHWIDPDLAWSKSAELLQAEGWIAILATAERYDDPFGASFREQWIRYSSDGGAWSTAPEPSLVETIASTGLFHDAITSTHRSRRSITPDELVRLEATRATTLSYDPNTRARFFDDMRALLEGVRMVPLTQETTVTMARVR
jgi:ubiquinone/menaquinone biosynthesis C-methylase UbiE